MNNDKSKGATVNSRRRGRASQTADETRLHLSRENSWNISEMGMHSTGLSQQSLCCICSMSTCTKISHRLVQVEMWRRASRASRSSTSDRANAVKRCKTPASVMPAAVHHAPEVPGQLDPFVLLPLKGITKTAMGQFHQYFTRQASSVFDPNRTLCFDADLLPLRFRQSVESAAVCASVITMAATLNTLRYKKLTTPDADLLVSYDMSLRALRNEIERRDGAKFSENTILAAINIATSCSIAFTDAPVARSHWQGVLALFNGQNPTMWNGPVIAWVDNFEWWLTVLAILQPRSRPWPVPISQGKVAPIEIYGSAFRALFDCAMKADDLTSKLLAVCLNMCRGVEMLEHLAKRPQPTSDSYFNYFRIVLMHQCTIVSGLANGSNTLAECITITINICFTMVLRVCAYRLPLQRLCSRLQSTIKGCGLFDFRDSPALTPSVEGANEGNGEEASEEQEEADMHPKRPDVLLQDVYIWMLGICICTARQSGDQPCQDWAVSALQEIYRPDPQLMGIWRTDILRRSRLFCWSDDFLSRYVCETDLWTMHSRPASQDVVTHE